MRRRHLGKQILYTLLFLGLTFSLIAPRLSLIIESGYSTKIYYWIIRPYSLLTGLFSFSLAELIVVLLVFFVIYKTVYTLISLIKKPKTFSKMLPNRLTKMAIILATIYIVFNLMWGLNYNRMTFADISGLSVETTSMNELAELAIFLTHRANELREQVAEDEKGVMIIQDSIKDMFKRAYLGFEKSGETYPELRGKYGKPKGVILSHYWSYTGIGGMYFPFTAEANVNINMPHYMLPATTIHEMVHQRGFAREDEANFIAYITCILHPDYDFQYSGVMLALTHTMNALYKYDMDTWEMIRSEFSEGVNRDLNAWREYRAQYQGNIQQISTNINNTYLIINRQEDGVNSYGRMVDLMLAYYRMKGY